MKLLENKYWISIILALAIGLIIGWIDTRPNWDDTGITVGLIFITSFLLGLITKKKKCLADSNYYRIMYYFNKFHT